MLRLTNLTLPLHHPDEAMSDAINKRLRVTPRDLVRHKIVRRGHDAADEANILLVFAGVILSATVDGIKAAEAVAKSLCRAA